MNLLLTFYPTSQIERFFLATLGLLAFIKVITAFQVPLGTLKGYSKFGLGAYFLAWPGVDIEGFSRRGEEDFSETRRFALSYAIFWLGLVGLLVLALKLDYVSVSVGSWGTIAGLLTMFHFGMISAISAGFRLFGWKVSPLFVSPLRSADLKDFWSRRWNLAFIDMDRRIFLPLIRKFVKGKPAIFLVFILSGLLHELAISFPVQGGWGLPTLYFLIQGTVMLATDRKPLPLWLKRGLGWVTVLAPLPLLFHAPFRERLAYPLIAGLHQFIVSHSFVWYLDWALVFAGFGHFLVLTASFQVPHRLGWRADLQKLTPFNRKLMWTYAVYIFSLILGIGIFTLNFHTEIVNGDRIANVMVGFFLLFWLGRMVVDMFVFNHADWPRGAVFVVGHMLLNTLFGSLVLTFLSAVLFHCLAG